MADPFDELSGLFGAPIRVDSSFMVGRRKKKEIDKKERSFELDAELQNEKELSVRF